MIMVVNMKWLKFVANHKHQMTTSIPATMTKVKQYMYYDWQVALRRVGLNTDSVFSSLAYVSKLALGSDFMDIPTVLYLASWIRSLLRWQDLLLLALFRLSEHYRDGYVPLFIHVWFYSWATWNCPLSTPYNAGKTFPWQTVASSVRSMDSHPTPSLDSDFRLATWNVHSLRNKPIGSRSCLSSRALLSCP